MVGERKPRLVVITLIIAIFLLFFVEIISVYAACPADQNVQCNISWGKQGYGWMEAVYATSWSSAYNTAEAAIRLTGSVDRQNFDWGYKEPMISGRMEKYWSKDSGWWYTYGSDTYIDFIILDGAGDIVLNETQRRTTKGRNTTTYTWNASDDDPGEWTAKVEYPGKISSSFKFFVRGMLNVTNITFNSTQSSVVNQGEQLKIIASIKDNAGNKIIGNYLLNNGSSAPPIVTLYSTGAGEDFSISMSDLGPPNDDIANDGNWSAVVTFQNVGDHKLIVAAGDDHSYWTDGRKSQLVYVNGTYTPDYTGFGSIFLNLLNIFRYLIVLSFLGVILKKERKSVFLLLVLAILFFLPGVSTAKSVVLKPIGFEKCLDRGWETNCLSSQIEFSDNIYAYSNDGLAAEIGYPSEIITILSGEIIPPLMEVDGASLTVEWRLSENYTTGCSVEVWRESNSAWDSVSRTCPNATESVNTWDISNIIKNKVDAENAKVKIHIPGNLYGYFTYIDLISINLSLINRTIESIHHRGIDDIIKEDENQVIEKMQDLEGPIWHSTGQTLDNTKEIFSILLFARWEDEISLDSAILSTNESGAWLNISSLKLEGNSFWSIFTWTNPSISPGTEVAWKIYANDSSGNWNISNTQSFNLPVKSGLLTKLLVPHVIEECLSDGSPLPPEINCYVSEINDSDDVYVHTLVDGGVGYDGLRGITDPSNIANATLIVTFENSNALQTGSIIVDTWVIVEWSMDIEGETGCELDIWRETDSSWNRFYSGCPGVDDLRQDFNVTSFLDTEGDVENAKLRFFYPGGEVPGHYLYIDDVHMEVRFASSDMVYPVSSEVSETIIKTDYFSLGLEVRWDQSYVNLTHAILSTNESGIWMNISTISLHGSSDYSKFVWSNPSIIGGTMVAWKVFANNSNGNWNETDIFTFEIPKIPKKEKPVSPLSRTLERIFNTLKSLFLVFGFSYTNKRSKFAGTVLLLIILVPGMLWAHDITMKVSSIEECVDNGLPAACLVSQANVRDDTYVYEQTGLAAATGDAARIVTVHSNDLVYSGSPITDVFLRVEWKLSENGASGCSIEVWKQSSSTWNTVSSTCPTTNETFDSWNVTTILTSETDVENSKVRINFTGDIDGYYGFVDYIGFNATYGFPQWRNVSNSSMYKKTITLSSATSIDDYNVKIELTTSNFNYTNARPDGGDIRFYDSITDTKLNYWIDAWNNTGTSTIWVKVPNSGTSSIYMKYGDPTLTSSSNRDSVVDFYYDFNGTTLDTSFAVAGCGTFSKNEFYTMKNNGDAWDCTLWTVSTYTRIARTFQAKFKANSGTRSMFGWYGQSLVNANKYKDQVYAIYFNNGNFYIYEDGANRGDTGKNYNVGQWYDIKIELRSTGAYYFYKLSSSPTWLSLYTSGYSSESGLRPGISHYDASGSEYSYTDDWTIIRYNSTGPITTLGAETKLSGRGEVVVLKAEAFDEVGIDSAILESNVSGTLKNYTDGTFGSPIYFGASRSWLISNFSWSDPVFYGSFDYRIWYNSTYGYYNVTDYSTINVDLPNELNDPWWSNPGQIRDTTKQLFTMNLSTYWQDDVILDSAILSTNESGNWKIGRASCRERV